MQTLPNSVPDAPTGARPAVRWRLGVAIAGVLLVAAPFAASAASTQSFVPAGAATATSGVAVKSQLRGILTRGGFSVREWNGVVHGMAVTANWSDLQPVRGGAIVRPNKIESAVQTAQQLNALHPGLNFGIKIRVMAGINAPTWAKTMDGSPVQVRNPQGGISGTVGRFWLPSYDAAYGELQAKLAAAYDGVAVIHETQVTRCTLVWDEPFIRAQQDPMTSHNLAAAGYTTALDKQCLAQEIDAHKAWKTTRSTLAFNPYNDADGKADDAFTNAMILYCRTALGQRCVLHNESFRAGKNTLGVRYTQMYAFMKAQGPAMSLQTAQMVRVGDLPAALAQAVALRVNSAELGPGYQQHISMAELARYDAELSSNPTGSAAPPLVTDTGAPTISVIAPQAQSTVPHPALVVSGTATDDQQVARVEVGLRNTATDQWLQADGSWSSVRATRVASLGAGGMPGTAWQLTISVPASGSYTAVAIAVDGSAHRTSSGRIPVTLS